MQGSEHTVRTVVLLVALSALFLLVGYVIGGEAGVIGALMLSLVMNIGSYWFSDKLVLALHAARLLPDDHPVVRMVRELTQNGGLPMPKVYIVPDLSPNAFATGRDPEHAAVCVTKGILKILDERQLRGVLSHEISHIKDRDILVTTVAATIASAIMYLAHMAQWIGYYGTSRRDEEGRGVNPLALLLVVILAPIASMIVQMAISRSREYLADANGARLSNDPEGLASALETISDPALMKRFQRQSASAGMNPAFNHLYIVNHFSGDSLLSLFSTHPPVKERVRRLRSMNF